MSGFKNKQLGRPFLLQHFFLSPTESSAVKAMANWQDMHRPKDGGLWNRAKDGALKVLTLGEITLWYTYT